MFLQLSLAASSMDCLGIVRRPVIGHFLHHVRRSNRLGAPQLGEAHSTFLDDLADAGKEPTPHQIVHTATALPLFELGISQNGRTPLPRQFTSGPRLQLMVRESVPLRLKR